MADRVDPDALADARVLVKKRRIPAIWLIPLVAVAIGAWLAWDTLSKEGPTITVSFEAAGGLKAGESDVRFKDISIGTVKNLGFSPDRRRVIVTIATTSQADGLIASDTEFWIVRPQLFAGSLRGLGTLISGPYIALRPGTSTDTRKRDFVGLENPPVLETEQAGTSFLVKAERLGSISTSSPVFFRDLTVGEVLGWDLGTMASSATIHVFVRQPFDGYVRESSRFWNASGVSLKLGGGGVQLEMDSLRALLLGGVGFDTPEIPVNAKPPAAGEVFPLYANRDAAEEASYGRRIKAVAYFPGSLRGVAVGNDVTLRGLTIGHVTGVDVTYDRKQDAIVAPVYFEVQPERLVGIGKEVYKNPVDAANALVKQGLRATLQSGSLITGQMIVALEFKTDVPQAEVTVDSGSLVIPVASGGGLGGLQDAANQLLQKVDSIPFEQIGQNLNRTLEGVDNVTNGPELKAALVAMTAALQSTQDLMHRFDAGAGPAIKRLPEISANLEGLMAGVNRLVLSLNADSGSSTKLSRDLDSLMIELNGAVRSIHTLADLLARHPDALIRGRTSQGVQ
jgi:paraquat-inducible protein B